jgi:hypothetical protein
LSFLRNFATIQEFITLHEWWCWPKTCFAKSGNLQKRIGVAHMRIDLYTKSVLTIIALLLAVIVMKPILQPQSALADGGFASIQFSYSGGNHAFFDTRSGDVWEYGDNGRFRQHYKVHELGKDHGR